MASAYSPVGDTSIVLHQALKTLSHAPRRRIIRALDDRTPRDVGEFLSAEYFPEHGDSKNALIALHHRHLPTMADAGYIEWDRENGTVTRGGHFNEIASVLKQIDDHRDELPGHWR